MNTSQLKEFRLIQFKDPDFRPNREDAKRTYADLVKAHAGVTAFDGNPFSQEIIEILMDARITIRSHMALHTICTSDDPESHNLFRSFIEHTVLSNVANTLNKSFEFRPVAGMVQYQWKSGKDHISCTVGSRIYDPTKHIIPVVWSESMAGSWNFSEEKERMKDRSGFNNDSNEFEDIDDGESWKNNREVDLHDDEPKVFDFRIGETANEDYCEPFRIDTCMYDFLCSEKIQSVQKDALTPSPISIHPISRELINPPLFSANGSFTAMANNIWSNNELANKVTDMFLNMRMQAYKYWNGE